MSNARTNGDQPRKRLKDPPKVGRPPKIKLKTAPDAWPASRPRPEPVPITGHRTRPAGANVKITKRSLKPVNGSHYQRKELVIAQLLESPSVVAAARKTGVSAATIRSWFKVEEFMEEYRQARQQVLELAISTTATHVDEAVKTLARNLTCGRPDSEIRAAAVILQWAAKFMPEQFRDTAGAKIAEAAHNSSTIIVVDGTENEYIEALGQINPSI